MAEKTKDKKAEIKSESKQKKRKFFEKYSKKFGKYSFVAWIVYQSVKGTLTLTFIWAPMFYYWFTHR